MSSHTTTLVATRSKPAPSDATIRQWVSTLDPKEHLAGFWWKNGPHGPYHLVVLRTEGPSRSRWSFQARADTVDELRRLLGEFGLSSRIRAKDIIENRATR